MEFEGFYFAVFGYWVLSINKYLVLLFCLRLSDLEGFGLVLIIDGSQLTVFETEHEPT